MEKLELNSYGGKDWKEMHQIVNSCFRENHVSCSIVIIFSLKRPVIIFKWEGDPSAQILMFFPADLRYQVLPHLDSIDFS